MSYPIKAHTLPLLEKILSLPGLDDQVKAFKAELDKWNAKHPDDKNDGKKHENLHDYLVSTGANQALYNAIYDKLGTSRCAPYTLQIPTQAEIEAYATACAASGKWEKVYFQSQPGYLMCSNETAADERIILNFRKQTDALTFADGLKDKADKNVSFKILLGNHLEAVNKNDKIVIYYPKDRRADVLAWVNAIPDEQLAPEISGFYMLVKPGVGITAETEPTWSFTMYTAEYCLKYLVNHGPEGKESGSPASAADMYDYAMRRLLKNSRILSDLTDSADLPPALAK